MKLTEAEREGLSDEEIEALEAEPSEDEAARGGVAGVAKEADPKNPGEEEEEEGEDEEIDDAKGAKATVAADKKPADAAKPATAAKPAEATEAEAEDTERGPLAVPFHHEATIKPEDVKQQLTELQAKYNDGEITLDELLEKRDAINIPAVKDAIAAEISAKSQDQTAKAIWENAVADFKERHPVYGSDTVLHDLLDARVKALANDPANDKLSDRQLLQKAHDELAGRFKVDDGAKPVDKKAAVEAKRAPDLAGAPRTLAGVPAAAENTTADEEFAHLDKLQATDSAGYERALAKMTEQQQERYLRAQAA